MDQSEAAAGPARVLLLEDSDLDADLILRSLERIAEPIEVTRVADGSGYVTALETGGWNAILSDYSLPGFDGLRALEMARKSAPETPFIFVSGVLGEEFAIESLQNGATDYVLKQRLVRLPSALSRALTEARGKVQRRRTDELFRTLADNIPTLCWMARADGHIVWYNRRWYEHTGTTPEQMEGWGWTSVHDPEVLPQVIDDWQRSLATGRPFEMTFPLKGADGSFRPFLTRIVPIVDDTGRIARWFGTNTDVTAQRAAEARLEELNATLERRVAEEARERDRIWRASSELMAMAGYDGFLKAINPAWSRMLGLDDATLLNRPFAELIHPDDLAGAAEVNAALARGEALVRFDDRLRHADGSWRWISWTATPGDDVFYAVGRDITAEKEQAHALKQAEEALRQSQKMEAVGQLTGGVAHDFNNLLTIITGNLELLQRRISDEDRRLRYLVENAAQGAQRAAVLTQRLLAFARRQPLQPKALSLNDIVAGMSDMLARSLSEEIEIETVLAGGLWQVEADPGELERALLNLAVNARDAMPGGGKLTIATANTRLDEAYAQTEAEVTPGQYVVLCVTDSGTGMTPEVLERVFEPFFTTKDVGQGTGLGLSQVYGFIKQSGGHVKVYSEVGEGTTFKLYLPKLVGGGVEEPVADLITLPSGMSDETVLVVEDDPDVRAYSVEVLSDLGYRVIEASNGRSALRILEGLTVDLLFTDVVLPGGMSGRDLALQVRAKRPDLKVLYTSGYSRDAIVHQGRLDPDVHLIGKPFTYAELAVKVRGMLDASSDRGRARRRVSDVRS